MNDAELRRKVLRDPIHLLAFGFGTGLSPKAPGTAGTLVAILLGVLTLPLPITWRVAIGFALTIAGFWLCGESARRIGVHDHPGIVWDEIAAMYLLLLIVPVTAAWWAAAFVLFRIFDIWKPWPIRDLDHRMRGGAGIMLDDLVAGLYAAILLVSSGWLLS